MGIVLLTAGSAKKKRLLSSIFLVVSLNILFQYLLRFTDLKHDVPPLLVIPDCLDLLLPSVLFLYVKGLVSKIGSKNDLMLYAVPVGWACVLFAYVAAHPDFQFASYIGTTIQGASLSLIVLWKLLLLTIIGYYAKVTSLPLSKKSRMLLSWLQTLIMFLGLITYISVCNLVFFFLKQHGDSLGDSILVIGSLVTLNYILFTCFILFISIYFFINNPSVFTKSLRSEVNQVPSSLEQLTLILETVDTQKLYLNPELSTRNLSEKLRIPPYILSKLLNEHLGKSFSEFINEKRIAEAQRLLELPENRDSTIYAIAVDSGFKSESGFYVNFKKFIRMTPNQYKRRVLSEETA